MTKKQARRLRRALTALAAFTAAAPAFADHMGPGSVGGGGGLTVIGADTLDEGHAAAGFRVAYTRPEQRSDAELAVLAGEHVHAHNTDYNLNAAVGLAYGVTHELTISAELPFVRRDRLREGSHAHEGGEAVNGVEQLGSISGIGDATILAKYRLTRPGPFGFALIGGLKLPTGSTHKRSNDGEQLETEHQPGTGSWDPLFGAAATFDAGTVQLSASALYQVATRGAQHTRLGSRLQGGVALSHTFRRSPVVNEHAHAHEHHHGDELHQAHEVPQSRWTAFVELGGEWEGRQRVDGAIETASGGKWVYVAPGARFTSASGWSAAAAIALPLWQNIRASHPDNRYRLLLSLGRAF